ncbi:methyl-accepting chemotaxis protein [Roseibium algae]|uniref:Methyl-accepting chemotaxis protein n=1 Tax=Roseibium algae TaxID=3123038 RepID=A0ABU8TH02_9HYPH
MNWLTKPLGNMRFSLKVGGGFATTTLLTAAVGIVGTMAILRLNEQSELNAKATSVMASLQQASADQEAFLNERTPELAIRAKSQIKQLRSDLETVDNSLDPSADAREGVATAIQSVDGVNAEFEDLVEALSQQEVSSQKLLGASRSLELQAQGIVDKMRGLQSEAVEKAALANTERNHADKLGRIVASVLEQVITLEQLYSDSSQSKKTGPMAAMQGGFVDKKTSAKAMRVVNGLIALTREGKSLNVTGVNVEAMNVLSDTALRAKTSLELAINELNPFTRIKHDKALRKEVKSISASAKGLRGVIYRAVDGARSTAEASQEKLAAVDSVAYNGNDFLQTTLAVRADTMELFAKIGSGSDKKVISRINKLVGALGVLKSDAATFPEIGEAVTELSSAVGEYRAIFQAMGENKEAYDEHLDRLSEFSEQVREQIAGMAATQSETASMKAQNALVWIGVTVLIAIAAGVLIAIALSLVITRPTRRLTDAMAHLAEGNTEVEIPSTDQRDEIGDMSRTVQVFRDNALERLRLEEESRKDQARREERQAEVSTLISAFKEDVQGLLGSLDETARDMDNTASSLGDIAARSSQQANDTASVSQDASMSVENVAGAAEELSASIAEIGTQVQRTTDIVSSATESVRDTNGKVHTLADAASKIGEVVTLIQAIAAQTNLLALNATIEAARAGDAGKGFAVVASEVKELATQTSKATEEIGLQVSTIQDSTTEAVDAIAGISATMEEVNGYTQAIASAVTQQGAATNEISGNVQRASEGTQTVQSNMRNLAETVEQTQQASETVLTSAGNLGARGTAIKGSIETFLDRVAAV